MRLILSAFVAALALTSPAQAQPVGDHLKCYKVKKDPAPKQKYTADLGGLVPEPGCIISVPAVMACVPATKSNVTPTPPGGGGTGTPNTFGCYKVKCPKATLPALQLHDQFGNRSVIPSASKLLCAPSCVPATTCPAGQTCGTASDGCGGTLNCGSCGECQTCGGGNTCVPAVESTACPGGLCCEGTCADTNDDPTHCGACGNNCFDSVVGGVGGCSNGACCQADAGSTAPCSASLPCCGNFTCRPTGSPFGTTCCAPAGAVTCYTDDTSYCCGTCAPFDTTCTGHCPGQCQ